VDDAQAGLSGASAASAAAGERDQFGTFTDADIRDLIAEYPLAWVNAPGAGVETATLLPMIAESDDEGRVVGLIGHLSRRNPLQAALAREGRGEFLFTGPHGYISPEEAGLRGWAPTWNYAQLRIAAEVRFDPPCTDEALAVLVEAMERGRADPWHSGELGERYAGMTTRIIGFRARITSLAGKFKLGQDEALPVLDSIIANIADPALKRWMIRFRKRRGEENG
jgi:transcriptional regulator